MRHYFCTTILIRFIDHLTQTNKGWSQIRNCFKSGRNAHQLLQWLVNQISRTAIFFSSLVVPLWRLLGWNGGLKTLMRFATLLVSLPASTLCRLRWVIRLRLCFRIVQSEEGGEHKNSWSCRGWIVPFFFRCFNSLHQLVHFSCSWSATVVLVSDPALVVVPASSLFVSSMKNARDAERVYDPKQERPETRSYTWHSLLDSMIQHVSCRMSVFRKVKYFWIFKWFEEMGEKIQVLQRDEDEGLTSACV